MARSETDAISLGVAFLGVKDIFSADNSSPQTTELNAKKRAPTLMKWVNIASVECIGLVAVLVMAAPKGHKQWPFIGGLMGLVVTYGQYIYAKSCGLKSMEPGTEDYGPQDSVGHPRNWGRAGSGAPDAGRSTSAPRAGRVV